MNYSVQKLRLLRSYRIVQRFTDAFGMKHLINSYLHRYAEPEIAASLNRPCIAAMDWVLVIPAFNESIETLLALKRQVEAAALYSACRVGIIWVLNCPEGCNESTVQQNQDVLQSMQAQQSTSDAVILEWIIDRVNQPIPQQQGVGLARKIGADLALQWIALGSVRQSVILNTDADVHIPLTYFQHWQSRMSVEPQHGKTALAWTYPFQHVAAEDVLEPWAAEFDRYLKQYVQGLLKARSPYAFYALGSIIGIEAGAYAMVRGFPKKSGGEDFYVLNKIRKLGEVVALQGTPLQIQARLSTRVPFGTGPRMQSALSSAALSAAPRSSSMPEFQTFSSLAFSRLQQVLAVVDRLSEHASGEDVRAALERLFRVQPSLKEALNNLGLQSWLAKSLRQPKQRHMQKKFHDWFDALKTLQFLKAVGQVTEYDSQV